MWWLEIILLEKWKWQIDKCYGERATWNWKAMLSKNSRFKRKIANWKKEGKQKRQMKTKCSAMLYLYKQPSDWIIYLMQFRWKGIENLPSIWLMMMMMMTVLQYIPMHCHFACIISTVFIPFSQVTGSNE